MADGLGIIERKNMEVSKKLDSNKEQIDAILPVSNISFMLSKTDNRVINLIANKNINPTVKLVRGVTFTVNPDYSVTVVGTATANIYYSVVDYLPLDAGTYRLSGCPLNGSYETYHMYMANNELYKTIEYGNGATLTITKDEAPTNLDRVQICVMSGVTMNHTFYPMIRKYIQ